MKNVRIFRDAIFLVLCFAVMMASVFYFEGRSYYLISLLLIIMSLLLFIISFEKRTPSVGELCILASLCALCVVSRISFAFLPQVKPMAAIIIITGVSIGAESGFMLGMFSAFLTNFYFGQGSWTPFQMFAFGMIGFMAGVFFRKDRINRIGLVIYGFVSVVVIYGLIVDLNTIYFSLGESRNWKSIGAIYLTGLPFNLIHGVATVVFLLVLYRPLLKSLERIKLKFGIMEIKKDY